MGLAAARGWAPGFRCDENQLKGRKRSMSPSDIENAKQQKMMILKAGDTTSLGKQRLWCNSFLAHQDMSRAHWSLVRFNAPCSS